MTAKPQIVIFGASKGGISAYHYFKNDYEIVAFADNDAKKHGKSFLGKPVVSAKDLISLKFDKIIIASLYALHIHRQLVCEEGISSSLIVRLPASFLEKEQPLYYFSGCIVAGFWIFLFIVFSLFLLYWL
ncbi:nucleoside-diphosphate sugar epimerase/dehydratase [Nitrincola alkalilacustris]|uniref:nucleoside-diphosphate sugar epimerase/dehydratase n=1 Tax=Nitrincola alkalilacustris TaxID=1571224 RepID=UPI00124CC809|nr:hypothetical protein [Nitrincola alkalilacustris]